MPKKSSSTSKNNKLKSELKDCKAEMVFQQVKRAMLMRGHAERMVQEAEERSRIEKEKIENAKETQKVINENKEAEEKLQKLKDGQKAERAPLLKWDEFRNMRTTMNRHRSNYITGMRKQFNKLMKKNNREPFAWQSCEICADQFGNTTALLPKVLACGHTICTSCVESLRDGILLICPFDRKYIHYGGKPLILNRAISDLC